MKFYEFRVSLKGMSNSKESSFVKYFISIGLVILFLMYVNRWGIFASPSYNGIEDDPNIFTVVDDNFAGLAGPESGLVLLDFWAPWCGPCRVFGPTIAEIAAEKKGEVTVGTVNIDNNASLGREFGISAIPTVVLLNNGKTVWQDSGVIPKKFILDEIQPFINASAENAD